MVPVRGHGGGPTFLVGVLAYGSVDPRTPGPGPGRVVEDRTDASSVFSLYGFPHTTLVGVGCPSGQ